MPAIVPWACLLTVALHVLCPEHVHVLACQSGTIGYDIIIMINMMVVDYRCLCAT